MIKKIVSALGIFLPSFATCLLFRLLGHQVGKNSKIRIFSYIYSDKIEIGNDVDIRSFVFIKVNRLVIGDNSIISFGTQIKGAKSFTTKGNNFVGAHCLINCDEDVRIGFYSGIGPRCTVYTHGSLLPITRGYPAKFEGVVLEDYVWIAMAVMILPGTHVESNVIVNPGLVLKSRIKSNALIELKPDIVTEMKLSNLQKLLRKDKLDHLKRIISGFLEYNKIEYVHNEQENMFLCGERYVFKYFAETNIIELIIKNKKKISYDLESFTTENSKLRIHKKFLFFLRRRCGIILQTNYNH